LPIHASFSNHVPQESRIWIRSKVQPHVGGGAGDTIGGVHGFAGEAEIDFRINHLAAMRYLWFIERRSAMQALLDLVQANLTAGEVCEVRDLRHIRWLHQLKARLLRRRC
jgi:hypothetical protein